MTTSDGSVVGTTTIVDNGAGRWNVVILSEGYQQAELATFAIDAQNFADQLLVTRPFDSLSSAVNVYRVDVASTDSGADDPAATGGTGATANTYFDATFGSNGIRRLLVVNTATARAVANAQVPAWNMIFVLVNSSVYGGSGGAVAVFSKAPSASEIGVHEMGHTAFGLADEYESYAGCSSGEAGHDTYSGAEPAQPNITANTNRDTIKWRTLVDPATPMPTSVDADCTQCDTQASPVAAGTVGAFCGAFYFHCGAYRPEYNCRMRVLGNSFCAVCQARIRTVLAPYVPSSSPPGDWVPPDPNASTGTG